MSIERINNDESNQVIIDKLKAIIEIESAKPISEQDIDLIDECVDYLMELENGIELTEEEIEEGKQQIYKLLDKKKKPQKKIKFKGLLIAACLAAMLLLVNFVAMACGVDTISILKEWGHTILGMFEGEKEEYGGVTIIKENQILTFRTMDEFKSNINSDILVPSVFPESTKLNNVSVAGSYDKNNNYLSNYYTISFATNNPNTSVIVHTNPDYPKDFMTAPALNTEKIGGHTCYYFVEGSTFHCSFVYRNITYIIRAPNMDSLKTIIENLKEN